MIVWADGGWDYNRSIGYSAVLREHFDDSAVVLPVFNPHSTSPACEFRALSLAIILTPDSDEVEIRMDSRTVVDSVVGNSRCSVLELIPHLKWTKRKLGQRQLVWIPREKNKAHVPMDQIFKATDNWSEYELQSLREAGRKRKD